jgi:DNA-binding CsgD family transcriptional regulator
VERVSDRWPLVGRSHEMALVEDGLGRSGSVVVTGAVGVGKSSLLAAVLDRLEAAGRPTVVVRATRSTASIPFGAFARWVPEHLVATRHWLGVLQGTASELVDVGPGLVVAVDDAQLLDEGSAALVLHLAQDTPASVLVTVRSGAGEPCPDAIEALGKDGPAARVDLSPLSEAETIELARRVLDGAVAPAARDRLWRLTEGNPLYLREVIDAGRAQGVLVRSASRQAGAAGGVAGAAGAGVGGATGVVGVVRERNGASRAVVGEWRWEGTLAGPSRLVELVTRRLVSGGPDERRVLELIALGEPLPVDLLARLAPPELLADIEARGLVVTEQPARRSAGVAAVRLAHPLYSEVMRGGLLPFTARARYHDLAEAAVAGGAERRDPLRVATWILESGGGEAGGGDGEAGGAGGADPELLLRAAMVAQILDEFPLSVRLAEAAERAGAGPRARLVRAGALGPLGRWAEAEALLSDLTGPDHDPELRAHALGVAADLAFFHQGEELAVARRLLRDAVGSLPAAARVLLMVQEARLAIAAFDLDVALRSAFDAAALADTTSDRAHALTTASLAATVQGRTRLAMFLVRGMVPYAFPLAETDPVPGSYAAVAYSYASVLDGCIDESAAVFAGLVDHRVVGIYGHMLGYPVFCLARAVMNQGKVTTATRLCRSVLDQVGDQNHFSRGYWLAGTLAQTAGQAGDRQNAAHAVAWLEEHQRVMGEPDTVAVRLGQAWWRASIGELTTARELALESAEHAGKTGAAMFEMLALLDVARLGGAASVAPRLEDLAVVVEGPYALAVARFAGALAAGDGAGLDDAAGQFMAMGARLLGAEAAAAASVVHRDRGRRRDEAASRALAQRLAAECETAATPLLATLAQEPPAATLTRREREVAELAARGRTSREIAQLLSVSLRTVDSHLDHAYTKLGITTRRDLPTALGLDP